jgi:cytochrome c oxidase cbb3-type subunit 2
MFERNSGVFFIAGLAFFALAFVSNAVVPALMYRNMPVKTVAELVNPNVRYQFEDLARRYPDAFRKAFGTAPEGEAERETWMNQRTAEALQLGHDVYVAEACWHCHSQFVRPVSGEEKRWGPVARSYEYANELQRPVLFGTRRVGPDLSREGGRRGNDWHAVHFFRPRDLSPNSPMPEYPWFFDGGSDKPNKRGLSLITYTQFLGSWLEGYPYYEDYQPSPIRELWSKTDDASQPGKAAAEPVAPAPLPSPEQPAKEGEQ